VAGKCVANQSDITVKEIGSFGVCTFLGIKCAHQDLLPWMGVQSDMIVADFPALLKSSTTMCPVGAGTISVEESGQ
jgi:hypothetical protein